MDTPNYRSSKKKPTCVVLTWLRRLLFKAVLSSFCCRWHLKDIPTAYFVTNNKIPIILTQFERPGWRLSRQSFVSGREAPEIFFNFFFLLFIITILLHDWMMFWAAIVFPTPYAPTNPKCPRWKGRDVIRVLGDVTVALGQQWYASQKEWYLISPGLNRGRSWQTNGFAVSRMFSGGAGWAEIQRRRALCVRQHEE